MGRGSNEVCSACKGSGVVRYACEYPNFEDERYCQYCDAGRALAARIADIVARTRSENAAHTG
jgi:hypothetical protein